MKDNLIPIKENEIIKLNLPYTKTQPFFDYSEIGNLTNGKYCVEYNTETYCMTYSTELETFKNYVDKRKSVAKMTYKKITRNQ